MASLARSSPGARSPVAKDGAEIPETEDGVAEAQFDGAGEAGSEEVAWEDLRI